MDGGHRDEDNPLDPPNRLNHLDQFSQFDHVGHLPQVDRDYLNRRDNHSLLLNPSDYLDAHLAHETTPSFSSLTGQQHHARDEYLQHHHQLNIAAVSSQHDLQPALLQPSNGAQSPPAPSHAAVSSPASSTLKPFPAFPTHDDTANDPGDFYRSFADDSFHSDQHNDATAVSFTAADLMAPAPPAPSRLPPISAHTSPNGLAIKQHHDYQLQQQHSQTPAALANRGNGIRSNRSVSTPVGNSSNNSTFAPSRPSYGTTSSSSTSVKDLKKRFDQINTGSTTSSLSNAAASSRSRPSMRIGQPTASSAARSRAGTGSSASTTRAKTPTNRSHPLPPVSSPNSFASRIGKPRNAGPASLPAGGNDQASRPTSRLTSPLPSPRAAHMASPLPPPPVTRANGLLFGEILPEHSNSLVIGYGIDAAVRPRRTSESILQNPPRLFTRSQSETNHDAEPTSPTDWYRSVASPPSAAFQADRTQVTSRIPTGHSRAHSDLAGTKPPLQYRHHLHNQHNVSTAIPPPPSYPPPSRLDNQSNNAPDRSHTSLSDMPQSPTSPTSRLPISVRKLSEASGRSSPASSIRSDSSTSVAGRRNAAHNRVPRHRQQHAPLPAATNTKTPTKRAAIPTSTAHMRENSSRGTTPSSARKAPPSHIATSSNNGRLSAYVSAPPPKLSPPLRSSRPRQPVSSANTTGTASRFGRTSAASSASSTAERSRMPYAGNTRASAARQDESRTGRRKIDVGPIDFAQRRETIRLKYSKSIRETEAVAAREAAAEKRKKELEAAAKAKALAEVAVRAQSEVSRRAIGTSSATLSAKSSASSLSASANAAAAATAASAAASAAAETSLKRSSTTSTTSLTANLAALAATSASSTTASRFPGTATPPPSSPTAATAAAAAATISSPQRGSPQPRRAASAKRNASELPSLRVSTSLSDLQPSSSSRQPTKDDSPTLGLPGAFPGILSSPSQDTIHEEPPLSAISANSVFTEFDNEAQTDPPLPESATSAAQAEESWQSDHQQGQQVVHHPSHERIEYRSPFDLPTPEHQLSQRLHTATPKQLLESETDRYGKSVCQYPFEDSRIDDATPMPNNMSSTADDSDTSPFDRFIPGSYRQDSYDSRPHTPPQDYDPLEESSHVTSALHRSPARVRELRQSPARQVAPAGDEEDITVQLSVEPTEAEEESFTENVDIGIARPLAETQDLNGDSEPTMPHRKFDPEYEVLPYRPGNEQQATTVTILARETAVSSRRPSLSRFDSSSSRHTVPDESNLDNSNENSISTGGFYAGPSLKDNIAMLRGSTFAPSEVSDENQHSAGETQRTPDTSNSLLMPSILSPANRSSQQSGWTDFSIESEDARAFFASRDSPLVPSNANANGHNNHATIRARIGPFASQTHQIQRHDPFEFGSRPDSVIDDEQQSQPGGSYELYEEAPLSSPGLELHSQHSQIDVHSQAGSAMLPELDTGTNFYIPYLTDDKISEPRIPVLPDHDPPPIPVSVDGRDSFTENSMRPSSSSAYYDSSRPNSFAFGIRDDHDGQDSFTFGGTGSADDTMFTSNPPPTLTASSSQQASLDIPRQSISGATLINNEQLNGADGTADAADAPVEVARKSGSPKKAVPTKEQTRLVQRQMVIRELIDTEAVFVRDMNIVEEIYKGTAEACPQLDTKTVKLIFRNTDEIIAFHTTFLIQLKDAVSPVYTPKGGRRSSPPPREDSMLSDSGTLNSTSATSIAGTANSAPTTAAASSSMGEYEDTRDRQTAIGPVFRRNIDQMKVTHEAFLRSSDNAAKRLIQIQEDPTVKLWLTECNEVAQDLTAAWNLDSLLIKPMQRITKYPNLISQLLQYTPADHPDRPALMAARTFLENSILEINKTKKNFELVGQIVGRKRKDSDVRAGFARAFGKRVDKLQVSSNRPPEDPVYNKLHEKFGDDYLRLQVVLRDVEFYTRQVSTYVHEFLQLLSAMELVMRLQASPYPEIESKWAHFNMSMRDMEKVALEQHLAQVRKHVIEPFELVIKCYGNPSLAMKKRGKRRLDYERAVQLKKGGKKVDKQLAELVEQYEALNETLKKELPMLSANTEKIGNICLGNFVNIQVRWFAIWKDKVKVVLEDQQAVPEVVDIMSTFARDFRDMEDEVKRSLSILTKGHGGSSDNQGSYSPVGSTGMLRSRSGRPIDLSPRVRGGSVNSDNAPTLPTPDFGGRSSGQFVFSPTTASGTAATSMTNSAGLPSPHQYYRDYYSGINQSGSHGRGSSGPITPGLSSDSSSRSIGSTSGAAGGGYSSSTAGGASTSAASGRPGTGRSYDSAGNATRPSVDSAPTGKHMPLPNAGQSSMAAALQASRRDSASTYNSNNQYPPGSTAGDSNSIGGGSGPSGRRFSGLFHSALPMSEDSAAATTPTAATATPAINSNNSSGGGYVAPDDASQRSFHVPTRGRAGTTSSNSSSNTGGGNNSGYNVLWLAASLFEFNIETKHEAGYPYLTYQAGEIFDVIAEKGELWLAKNQDDPIELVGWIWSKHFAKLADS